LGSSRAKVWLSQQSSPVGAVPTAALYYAGFDPSLALTAMLDLQGKINSNLPSRQLVSDTSLAAAMLAALPDADWAMEKAVLKEKKTIAPDIIIAKVQVKWPGKSL
jgi:multisubunit Na+/H+ antiporter MnhE subunit